MKTSQLLRFSLLTAVGAAALTTTASTLSAKTHVDVSLGFRVPNGYAEVNVGPDRYYTHRGVFYRRGPHGLIVARAPRGAFVHRLPPHYTRVYVGTTIYYRYNDIYYQTAPDGYVVVDAPPTVVKPATVVEESYESVWRDGTEYLFKDGQFFRKTEDGLVWMEAPQGALTKTLPADATSVWYGGNEYYEVDSVYFRKTPDGYMVVLPPWGKK